MKPYICFHYCCAPVKVMRPQYENTQACCIPEMIAEPNTAMCYGTPKDHWPAHMVAVSLCSTDMIRSEQHIKTHDSVELTAAGFRLLMQDLKSSGIFNPTAALLSIMLCCEFHCGWSGLLTIIKCSVSRAWVGVAEEDAGIAWDGGRWSAVATPKGRRRQKKQQLSPCKTKACREDMVSWYDDDKRMTA